MCTATPSGVDAFPFLLDSHGPDEHRTRAMPCRSKANVLLSLHLPRATWRSLLTRNSRNEAEPMIHNHWFYFLKSFLRPVEDLTFEVK